jgi:hypothetical protein
MRKKKIPKSQSKKIPQITLKPPIHHDQPLDPITTDPLAQRTKERAAEQQPATAMRKACHTQTLRRKARRTPSRHTPHGHGRTLDPVCSLSLSVAFEILCVNR